MYIRIYVVGERKYTDVGFMDQVFPHVIVTIKNNCSPRPHVKLDILNPETKCIGACHCSQFTPHM